MRGLGLRLALAVTATTATLFSLEIGARLLEPGAPGVHGEAELYDTIRDPYLGYRLRKSARFRATKHVGAEEPCYDVVYTTDSFGRRAVGSPRDGGAARPRLVIFGCSFTFGEGLNDEETLQFQLGRSFDVINYAVHGYGLQHALAFLREDRLRHEVPPGQALGLYILYNFHFERAVLTSDYAWLIEDPYFEVGEDGVLHQFPTFRAAHPVRAVAYGGLGFLTWRSALVRRLDLHLPRRPDPKRAELVAAMLIEAARRFEERWQGPFVVAVASKRGEERTVQTVISRLRAANVAVLDYSTMEVMPAERLCEGHDAHPNGRYNARLAELLERDLQSAAE